MQHRVRHGRRSMQRLCQFYSLWIILSILVSVRAATIHSVPVNGDIHWCRLRGTNHDLRQRHGWLSLY